MNSQKEINNNQNQKKRGRPKKIIIQKPINNNIIEQELIIFYPIHINNNNDNNNNDNNNDNNNKILSSLSSSNFDSIIINNKDDFLNIKYSDLLLKCPFSTNNNNIIIEPKYTNICCMYDSCKIKGKPYFLPDKFINGVFYIIGWFCSLNCALAYNLNLKDNNINQRTNLLYYLYQINNQNILPAPDKILLKKFGGQYNIKEFRNLNKHDDYIILNNYNLICNKSYIEIVK